MNFIKAGCFYSQVTDKKCFRIFTVAPDEDIVIVARIDCTSTRLRRLSLTSINAAIAARTIIPLEVIENSPLPKITRTPAVNLAFEKIRPALQKLLEPGIAEISQRKLWPEIVRLAKEIDVAPSNLNRAFSQVLMAGGVIDAAIPKWHNCGRKPSSGKGDYIARPTNQPNSYHLSAVDLSNIATGVRKYLRSDISWKEAHDKFLEYFYPERAKKVGNVTIMTTLPEGMRPSLFQFKYHGCQLVSLPERIEQQFGKRIAQTDHRGRPNGQSALGIYPGVISEIDWTFTDIVGVARGSRLSIGRFVFYAVADVHCGIISSAYATMYSGTAHEAGRALVQCLEDKVPLCAQKNLIITNEMWDVRYFPAELRSDRGEINSWKSTGLGTALGIKLEYCPSKRPDLKGTIESFFRVIRYYLRRLRGGTSGHRERLKDHPNVTAIYDFDEVQKLLYIIAIAFNARIRRRQALSPGMVASQVRPIPNEIYKWANDRGCVGSFSIEKARIGALPTHFANVTAEGIKIKGLRFVIQDYEPTTNDGIDANEWLIEAKRGCWRVEIGIDPSTVNHIWLRHRPQKAEPIAIMCPLSAEHEGWRDLSWIEYGHNKEEYKASIKKYEEVHLREIRAWTRGEVAKTTAKAKALTGSAREGMSATAQIEGAGERRKHEMNNDTQEQKETSTPIDFFDESQWGAN